MSREHKLSEPTWLRYRIPDPAAREVHGDADKNVNDAPVARNISRQPIPQREPSRAAVTGKRGQICA
jgi:hypothetical protein